MRDNDSMVLRIEPQRLHRAARDIAVRGAVETVAPHALFAIQPVRDRIGERGRTHGLMERGVENDHLGNGRHDLHAGVDSEQIGGIVQRRQRRDRLDVGQHLRRHQSRGGEALAAVDDAMSDDDDSLKKLVFVEIAQDRGQRGVVASAFQRFHGFCLGRLDRKPCIRKPKAFGQTGHERLAADRRNDRKFERRGSAVDHQDEFVAGVHLFNLVDWETNDVVVRLVPWCRVRSRTPKDIALPGPDERSDPPGTPLREPDDTTVGVLPGATHCQGQR